jgi:hypothetical protein
MLVSASADFEVLFEDGHENEGCRVGKILLDVGQIIEVDRGKEDEEPDDCDPGIYEHTSHHTVLAGSYEKLRTR